LQHVQSLEDEHVGSADDLPLIGHDIVGLMRVHRSPDFRLTGLHVGKELHHPFRVIALGEALARHQLLFFKRAQRIEKPIRRHEVHLGMVGPSRHQRLEDAGESALADSHAAGDGNYVGATDDRPPEERVGDAVQIASGPDMQVEQTRKRQVHIGQLVERNALVDAPKREEVFLSEGKGRVGTQERPFGPGECLVRFRAHTITPRSRAGFAGCTRTAQPATQSHS
jgi:hypothetical protein